MGFGSYLLNGVRMLAFRKDVVRDVVDDRRAWLYASILIVLYAFLFGIISVLGASSVFFALSQTQFVGAVIVATVVSAIVFLAVIGLFFVMSRLLGSRTSFLTFAAVFVASSLASLLIFIVNFVVSFVPFAGLILGIILMLFSTVFFVFVLREACGISTLRAVFVWLLSMVVLIVALIGLLVALIGPDALLAAMQAA